ncbi:MAG: iron ABC transporter permease [Stappia sp.]|uniref:ABC transporter permease n=1 Tax=Stappia sp. TaxID=1870903 RepID=UPI000C608908|nr:iron ABC transporter permease [Stappia sp.]MAB00188.1 iron ABC transporter permease [Stappia sp.]MBM21086.1 iron ABC transporter permease [Stappia sp.]|tara:strand:- start:368 stop:2083 length:1716 start_codon:yes stop_codon:yes gene_type:complete
MTDLSHPLRSDAAQAPRSAATRSDRLWTLAGVIVAALTLLPVLSLALLAAQPTGDVWTHLVGTVLPRSLWTTFLLMAGVGALTLTLGVGTAWLVTMCRFPGRAFFDWALLVPLAVPTYIIAYTYVEILDYTGPVQSVIRAIFGFTTSRDYWFPEVRSLGGAIFVMGFVLYPYVYLTTRASFLLQSACALDVSRTLGAGPMRLFFRVALPLARPAIVVGVSLALMECLNDIGAVTFFGVQTMTFSVYDTWINRSSLAGASQLAVAMLALVFALLWIERHARRRQRFHVTSSRYQALPGYRLGGARALGAMIACAVPILVGFVFPAMLLADYASRRLDELTSPALVSAMTNTLTLSVIASLMTVVIAIVLVFAQRVRHNALTRVCGRIAAIGYAIPGTVLAVGILIPLARFDNMVDAFARSTFGVSTGLLLVGTGTALVYAYMVRFLAVAHGQIEGGLGKVTPHLDMAARTLGRTSGKVLWEVHVPMIRPVLLTALLLAFVDCMKELPATILLRPFNFETLATTVYNAASREAFGDGALPALVIVLVGLVPAILLARTSARSFRDRGSARQAG